MKKILALTLAVLMIAAFFTACDKGSGSKDGTLTEVTMWMRNTNGYDTGPGTVTGKVEDAVNKIIEEKLNIHINFVWVNNADYGTQLNLALANREVIDIASYFYSNPLDAHYSSGGTTDITDLIDKNAPDLRELMGSVLDMAKINGRMHGIPTYRVLNSNGYLAMRADTLEAAGVLELAQNMTTWAEFEEVCGAITDKGDMYALGGGGGDGALPVRNLVLAGDKIADTYMAETLSDSLYYVDCNDEGEVSFIFKNPDFVDGMKMLAKWNDAGFFWPDTAHSQEDVYTLVASGVFAGQIFGSEFGIETQYADRIGTEAFVMQLCQGIIDGSGARNIGVFIPATSAEPEAALKVINEFWTNKDLMTLIDWGIEGKSYEVNANGEAQYIGDNNAVSCGYHLNDFFFGNQFLPIPWDGSGANFREEALQNMLNAPISKFLGVSVDLSGKDTLVTALTAVSDEYYTLLTSGFYTDALYKEFLEKMDAAGIDEYLALFQSEVSQYKS